MKRRFVTGDEWDALSRRSRRLLRWRAGERKAIKQRVNRRERRAQRRGGDDD